MSRPLLLLVDDAPELAAVVSALGRRAGSDVAWRPDVHGAWEFLRQARPDLILLDVNLAGERGPELCRRLRGTAGLADLAVALFSHEGLGADVAEGLEAGADFLFAKDLLGRPADWRCRLDEILRFVHGHPRGRPLRWKAEADLSASSDWVVPFNQALCHPAVHKLGTELRCLLLRRALTRGITPHPSTADLDAWTTPDGALNAGRVRPPAECVPEVVASLAEQVWRLLGAEASAPFRRALAAVVPGDLDLACL